ncbi:MAG: C25 family cysteine peptidase [Bacteroidota bacterium]
MRFSALLILSLLGQFSFAARWTGITANEPSQASVTVLSQSETELVLFVRVEGFNSQEVMLDGSVYQKITAPGCTPVLQAGAPDLPKIVAPLLVPGGGVQSVEVVSSSYRDFPMMVLPGKGNLYRDQDPASIPFVFGAPYVSGDRFPSALVDLQSPYVLRDFTGQSLRIFPFQYDHTLRSLRVYHAMVLRIKARAGEFWPSSSSVNTLDADFSAIYARHFLNFNALNYTPLFDQGNMLVIADSSLMPAMEPFVSWKNRKGQPTEMVSVQSVGSNPTAIRNFVSQYYQNNGLTFLLLVGDNAQVPAFSSPSGDSDPSYGFLVGNDSYAEVIVGRYSANTELELATQVYRTLEYEQRPDTSAWLASGICIASDQGPGDDNEMDFEHARNMRQDLLGYHYTGVDELYDGTQGLMDSPGSPTAADLQQSINTGRGIITYTGHGSTSGFGTTGFSASDIAGLTNAGHLPFIWSVACVNGNFVNSTCLAEALLRARDSSDRPVGALATLMSTINQSWDPPMDAQDEMVDILVESYPSNIRRTFGGISVNGCMHMNDQYGSAGDEITETWTCFGDPSVPVRTAAPHPLFVQHPATIDESATVFQPTVSDDGALVCLSHHGTIIARGWSLLGSAMLSVSGLVVGDTLEVTGTAYNALPYSGTVVVTSSSTGIVSTPATEWSIYPNPTSGVLFLQTAKTATLPFCKLFDATGRMLLSTQPEKTSAGSFRMNLPGIPSGLYYLEVISDVGTTISKVLIN